MRSLPAYTVLLSLVTGLSTTWSTAQTYPTKPIKIHASGPGGNADFNARLVATQLSATIGQQVIVENRAPAVLTTSTATAPADGYTLMVAGGPLWLAPLLETPPYGVQDFAPITALSRSPYILVINAALPVKTVDDLVRLAKAQPGKLNYTSGSTGSGSHLTGELFKALAGVNIVRVSYKAQAQETADMLSGQVHMTFGPGASWDTQVKAGKLRSLATGGTGRSLLYPDLPTVNESLPGFVAEQLLALWTPARTPEAVISRLNQETVKALARPEVREQLLKTGQEPVGGTPEQLMDIVKGEVARLGKVIRDNGIKRE